MFFLTWLVPGSIVCLFPPAYAEPVHLPLIRHVLPHSDSAVARSLLGVERRDREEAGLSLAPSGLNLIPVNFGTPTQTLPLVLSFTLPGAVVAGCNVETCSSRSSSTLFNYTKSSSARNKSISTQTISTLHEIGIPASVFADVIGLGTFSVLDASFFVSDPLHLQFLENGTAPGIFGLGPSSQNLPSLWQSLLSSNQVDAPEMGIWLSRVLNTSTLKAPEPGVFTFGGTNSSLYIGDIEFFNSTSTSVWALNITTLTIQGHELTFTHSNNVAFDVGMTLIYGPTSIVATIWAQVPGASPVDSDTRGPGSYQYLSFGGHIWTLDPAELNAGKITGGNNAQCLGAIVGLDEAEDQAGWIFGETFLRGVYTVLRQGNPPAVGFAELSEQAGGAPSPTLHSTTSSGLVSLPSSSTPPSASAKKSPVAAVAGGVIGALILCAALLAALLLTRRHQRQNHPELNLMDEDEGGVNRNLVPEPFVATFNSAEQRSKGKLQANDSSLSYPSRIDAGSGSATQPDESAGSRENGSSSSPAAAAADVSVIEELRNLREEMRRLAERDPGSPISPPSYHPDA
ncbi:aspartic peptidase domain-containing protein [Favolaschia claudopus]|uniref:Aspartic peptidase domain-containing protein n=1 Tax=Favolaschia claudopus TaxID=2862362 RepID=A0AAW0BIB4_9AGAR